MTSKNDWKQGMEDAACVVEIEAEKLRIQAMSHLPTNAAHSTMLLSRAALLQRAAGKIRQFKNYDKRPPTKRKKR